MDTNMRTIENNVRRFHPKYAANEDYEKMITQIDKYWKKLFADPITVDSPNGKVSIQPQRTNNLMERFFRDIKSGHRRKTGNHSMSKMLQAMLADTPLVKNLQNDSYIKILLNGKPTLEALFAEIESASVRKEMRDAQASPEKIPDKIKKIITQPQLPQMISRIFLATEAAAPV